MKATRLDLSYAIESAETLDNRDLFSPDLLVKFSGPDVELLLLYRAELLLALEHLTLEALRVPHRDRYRLVFDAEDYRVTLIEELRLSAQAAAEKVKRAGVSVPFSADELAGKACTAPGPARRSGGVDHLGRRRAAAPHGRLRRPRQGTIGPGRHYAPSAGLRGLRSRAKPASEVPAW